MRSSSSDPDWENGNGDSRPIAVGESLTIAALKGPGIINHIWNTVFAEDKGYSKLLVLRMYWDDEETPSVEVPLGDFFAMGHGLDYPLQSLPVTVTCYGHARNCYWPMPFRKSAKITVTNEGSSKVNALFYYVDWQQLDSLPENSAYFHAMYRQEFPAEASKNYLIAEIEGKGNYVGTVLSVRQRTPSWWGEGDDFWFIDGETEPSLRGTGTEDYFCDAWGFREMSTPYYGAPLVEGGGSYSRTSCYRWHIADPVVFQKSLRLEIEHKGETFDEAGVTDSWFAERGDDFSSVAYWYQVEPHKAFPALPDAQTRLYEDWSKMVLPAKNTEAIRVSSGAVSEQVRIEFARGHLVWNPAEKGESLALDIDLAEEAKQQLVLVFACAPNHGIFQVELDGAVLVPSLDLYNANITDKQLYISLPELEAGTYSLRFLNKGKAARSEGHAFGLEGYLLK